MNTPHILKKCAFLQSLPLSFKNKPFSVVTFRTSSSASTTATQAPTTLVASAAPRRMPAIIRPWVPSPALLEFVEDTVHPRSTIVRALGDYVRANNLQDPNKKTVVICDQKLKALLGVDQCNMTQISRYITPHLSKPEAVGGRYENEAKLIEETYVREKALEHAKNPKKKKKVRRAPREGGGAGNNIFKPVTLSDELAAICRRKEMPRPQIVKAIWEYIRLNNLKGKPGEAIRCDFLMEKVYNEKEISVKGIMKGIEPHIVKK